MNKISILASRLKEVLTEGSWVTGTNFKREIEDLHWKEAVIKVGSLNTIADLTAHISYYLSGVSKVLEGGSLEIKDAYSFEHRKVTSEEEWQSRTEKFIGDAERFIFLVEQLEEPQLSQIFVKEEYGNYERNIDVMIEHAYYHLGQVVLIKKLIRSK